jgi:hypothetical protein
VERVIHMNAASHDGANGCTGPDLAYTGYECDIENARRFLEQ